MGRLTVFTIADCQHCAKAKRLLDENNIGFYEISLTDYPEKRADMIKASQRMTVPAIFLNESFLGGAKELAELMESGMFATLWEEANRCEFNDIGGLLSRPDHPANPIEHPRPRKIQVVERNGVSLSFVDCLLRLRRELGVRFSGSSVLSFALTTFQVAPNDHKQGVGIASDMFKLGVFRGQQDEVEFDVRSHYILPEVADPTMLNTFRDWDDRVDDPMVLVNSLKTLMQGLRSKYRDEKGLVDYIRLGEDEKFALFEEASCEVQKIELSKLDSNTRLAFCINLYNVMILHAFAKVGVPDGNLARLHFFDNIGYVIGGHKYPLSTLENGVLRVNKVPPYHFFRTIPKGDGRQADVMPMLDNRIHFALNCGAHSCPPVKRFTSEAIQEELDLVSKSFFDDDNSVSIDPNTCSMTVSTIINWYKDDFGGGDQAVVETIKRWLPAEKVSVLEGLSSVRLEYFKYDWTTDAAMAKTYSNGKQCSVL